MIHESTVVLMPVAGMRVCNVQPVETWPGTFIAEGEMFTVLEWADDQFSVMPDTVSDWEDPLCFQDGDEVDADDTPYTLLEVFYRYFVSTRV